MKQFYIGLADIVLGEGLKTWNTIPFQSRMEAVQKTQQQLLDLRNNIGATILYGCQQECYGTDVTFATICSTCIETYHRNVTTTSNSPDDDDETDDVIVIPIMGTAIHILESHNDDVHRTVEEIHMFLNIMQNEIKIPMIYVFTTLLWNGQGPCYVPYP